ncbi:hypothetical protein L209DRAFT_758744 [Thermothelomyces heterothallicus CBS 203.75]
MNGATPRFWAGPLRYWRWAARERPAFFWSVVIGALGPVTLAVVPPIRRALGDEDAAPIPLTYPGTFFLSTRPAGRGEDGESWRIGEMRK